MGPFVKNQYAVGTKVWVRTIDNLKIIGMVKGYNEREGEIESINLQVEEGAGVGSIIEIYAHEITAIFDV